MNSSERKLQISFDSFETNALKEFEKELKLNKRAQIGFTVQLGVKIKKIDEKSATVTLTMTVDTLYRKTDPVKIAQIVGISTFTVKGLDMPEDETSDLLLPNNLLVMLTSITYSTLRGAFIEKSKNTRLEGNLFPIIDPSNILENPKPAIEPT